VVEYRGKRRDLELLARQIDELYDWYEIAGTDENAILRLGANATGSASGTPESQITESWEMDWREIHKPLAQHSAFQAISAQTLTEIEDAVADGSAYELLANYDPGDPEYEYIVRRLRGQDSYLEWVPVVRRTRTASRRMVIKILVDLHVPVSAQIEGAGREVHPRTKRQVQRFQLPGGYEWLKLPPVVQSLGRSRYRVTEEWLGAKKWDGLLYEGGSGP